MTAFNLRLCTAATNTDTMHANEGGSVTLQLWRRGWDTHPVSFAILPCFQQHARKPHGYWPFLRSRLFQLNLLFQLFGSNFAPKQTPKTPRRPFLSSCRLHCLG